jgi:hypothetical protein
MATVITEGQPPVDLRQASDEQVRQLVRLGAPDAVRELARRRRGRGVR